MAGGSAAQVRGTSWAIGYTGTPAHGYDVQSLIDSIGSFMDAPGGMGAGLVGVGNQGRADLAILGAAPQIVHRGGASIAIRRKLSGHPWMSLFPDGTTSGNGEGEKHSDRGDLGPPPRKRRKWPTADRGGRERNSEFRPVRLHVPSSVYVEDNDITTSLEKVAYFARNGYRN
jgi:redox-sensing transcriptional repressor